MKLNKFDFVPDTRNNVTNKLRIVNNNERKEMAKGIWRVKMADQNVYLRANLKRIIADVRVQFMRYKLKPLCVFCRDNAQS